MSSRQYQWVKASRIDKGLCKDCGRVRNPSDRKKKRKTLCSKCAKKHNDRRRANAAKLKGVTDGVLGSARIEG
jgi:uncharacterized OB-fold protein